MCFAGRIDIMPLLHDELRGLRRPEHARHLPEAASVANRRMAAAALCGRIRASFEAPAVRLPIAPPGAALRHAGSLRRVAWAASRG